MIETVPVDEEGNPVRPGVNGGMYRKDQPELKPVNYILVDDIDESIQKIKNLGGTITPVSYTHLTLPTKRIV